MPEINRYNGDTVIAALTDLVRVDVPPGWYRVLRIAVARTLGVAAATVNPRGLDSTVATDSLAVFHAGPGAPIPVSPGYLSTGAYGDVCRAAEDSASATGWAVYVQPNPDVIGDTIEVQIDALRVRG